MKSIAFEISVIVLISYLVAGMGVTIIKAQRNSFHHTVCERHAHSR